MLTEKQTNFLRVWLDHQTWPVETENKEIVLTYNEVLPCLIRGTGIRFQAPLDADGEPLQIEGEYWHDRQRIKVGIDHENHRIMAGHPFVIYSFFDCPTLRKHRPEPAIPEGWYILSENEEPHAGDRMRLGTDWIDIPGISGKPTVGTKTVIRRLPKPEQDKWRPEYGKEYWTFNADKPYSMTWTADRFDRLFMRLGIVYRTEAEAEAKRKELGL